MTNDVTCCNKMMNHLMMILILHYISLCFYICGAASDLRAASARTSPRVEGGGAALSWCGLRFNPVRPGGIGALNDLIVSFTASGKHQFITHVISLGVSHHTSREIVV